MKIKEKLRQSRRDFYAIYVCEHCGYKEEKRGYDDAYFHNSVIPNMECPKCGKKASEDYEAMKTVYPEGYQI